MSTATTARTVSLKRNVSWVLLGNLLYAAANWGGSIVFAKLGTPEAVGKYALAVGICQPISTLAMMNLRAVLATDTHGEHRFADYLGLRVATSLLGFLVMLAFAGAAGRGIDTTLTIVVYGIGASIETLSDIYNGVLQRYERMEGIGISLAFRGVLSLVLQAILFWLTKSVPISMLGYVAASLAGLLLIDIPRARRVRRERQDAFLAVAKPQFEIPVLRLLALTSLPLGVSLMLTNLSNFVSRYFIVGYLGEHQLGLFSAVAMLVNLGSVALNAGGTSIVPRLARHWKERNLKAFHRLVQAFFLVAGAVGLIGILAARFAGTWILTHLFRPEYARQGDVFTVLMISGLLLYVSLAFGMGLTAMREFKIQAKTSVVTFVAAVVACAVLIPSFGTLGAAWAGVVAMSARVIALFVTYAIYSRRVQQG